MNEKKRPIVWVIAALAILIIIAIVIWALNRDTQGVIDPYEDVDAVVIDEPVE